MARPQLTTVEPDLSPFVLSEVPYKDRKLRFREPITFVPFWNDTGELLCFEYTDWSLYIFAETREELIGYLYEEIAALWGGLARKDDSLLTERAQDLSRKLRAFIQEIPRAKK